MNTVRKTAAIAVMAAMAGAAASYLMLSSQQLGVQSGAAAPAAQAQRKPLYWVAPMDPAYRRDAPGKSPMGMDLVPVYESDETIAGTVRISPQVINNLGVRIAPVEYQVLPTRIRTVGYVQYDEDRRVHIHPRVEGWIEKLYVKASGDPVEAGQPLYELYSPQLVNAQEELVLALKRDNSRLVAAAEDRLRALQLSPDSIARLRRDREVKQTVTFHAPQTGVVDNLNVREGFFVMPGTTLMSVGVLEEVWVEAEVFERQASLVSVGLPVTMSLDYLPSRDWQGRVDYVYPSLDEENRTLRVRLRFANEDRILKPNMFAQVVIQADPVARALVVPREAVIRTGKQDRVVLALGEGRFASRVVGLGRVGEHYIEILEGLAEHDEVVVSAQFLLDSESSKSADLKRMDSGDSATAFPTGESGAGHRHEMGGSHD